MAEKRKQSLLDKMEEEKKLEEAQQAVVQKKVELVTGQKSSVLDIADSTGKDKQISAKVNEKVYGLFTQINKAQGISNNSALNMIINKYVRENKGILNENLF